MNKIQQLCVCVWGCVGVCVFVHGLTHNDKRIILPLGPLFHEHVQYNRKYIVSHVHVRI